MVLLKNKILKHLILLPFVTLTAPIFVRAQSALNSGGITLKDISISYAYSIGEVSGFLLKPYCSYTQGVIQPARFSCFPVKYEYADLYEIAVYPNPTTGKIIIETDYSDFAVYKIMSLDGKLLQTGKFLYTPISIATFPRGIYLLQLLSSDYKIRHLLKIIKY